VLEMVSPDSPPTIIKAYETALERNPRFLPARLALARYLTAHGQREQAQQILWQGLGFSYRQLSPAYLELLEMNLATANQSDNHELASQLTNALMNSRQGYAAMLSAQKRNSIINPY
jgi:thioredoxin-like negative regulator of GroEL